MSDIVSLDLRSLTSPELKEAYGLIDQIPGEQFALYVDDRVLKSSLTPKRKYKFATGKVPSGAVKLSGLKSMVAAVKALEAFVVPFEDVTTDPELPLIKREEVQEVLRGDKKKKRGQVDVVVEAVDASLPVELATPDLQSEFSLD